MPQMGIHLTIGLLGNRYIKKKHILFGLGFFWGSLFPDFDFLFLIPFRFIDRDLALLMHRSLTHSFLFLFFLFLIFLVFYFKRKNNISKFLSGFIIGISIHIFLDIFMWFSGVELFWPFLTEVNIYRRIIIPDYLWNLMSGLEPACYGMFLIFLGKITQDYKKKKMHIVIVILFVISAILLLFITRLERKNFELFSYSSGIILGFFPSLYYIYLSREILFKDEV